MIFSGNCRHQKRVLCFRLCTSRLSSNKVFRQNRVVSFYCENGYRSKCKWQWTGKCLKWQWTARATDTRYKHHSNSLWNCERASKMYSPQYTNGCRSQVQIIEMINDMSTLAALHGHQFIFVYEHKRQAYDVKSDLVALVPAV